MVGICSVFVCGFIKVRRTGMIQIFSGSEFDTALRFEDIAGKQIKLF